MPVRIRRSRVKGYRLPLGAVYVGRPTKWGNPLATADLYRQWLLGGLATQFSESMEVRRQRVLRDIQQLRGRDLACWCPLDHACHADVLLELANGSDRTTK